MEKDNETTNNTMVARSNDGNINFATLKDLDDDETEYDCDSDESCSDFDELEMFASQDDQNYMETINNILSQRCEVNWENALALNKEMQIRLHEVREVIQKLLQNVQKRILTNEERLKFNMKRDLGTNMHGALLNGGTFYFKGNMFFKDLKFRNCPNNSDYEYRSKIQKEMFPMDFELCGRHVWSLKDKMGVVHGLKEQAIDYLTDREQRTAYLKRNKNYSKAVEKRIAVHSKKLVNLLEQVDENFQIDWEQISIHNVRRRHAPKSCEAMWKVYLHPSLNHSTWTSKENDRLLEAVTFHNFQNWDAIGEMVGKRSGYQCIVQYQTSVCYKQPNRWSKWNKKDDQLLLDLVEKHTVNGVINWSRVTTNFPNKPRSSVLGRYTYSLCPNISHERFTQEEDLLLLAAVKEYGNKFACFPRTLFPNRSLVQLRSRYFNTLHRRHEMTPWSVEDDEKLIKFVDVNGTSAWLKCAQALGNHNRTSCRTRYMTIKNFFAKNPTTTIKDVPRKKIRLVDNSITPENWVEKVKELRENPHADFTTVKRKKCRKIMPLKFESPKNNITNSILKEDAEEVSPLVFPTTTNYMERLRDVGIESYDFFKYAYKFRLGQEVITQCPNSHYSLRLVANSLSFQVAPDETVNFGDNLPLMIHQKCKEFLSRTHILVPPGYQLPPSWSTAIAYRALLIQFSQIKQIVGKKRTPVPDRLHKNNEVKLFRRRLFSLFNKTCLLSRVHPSRYINMRPANVLPSIETTNWCKERNFIEPVNLKQVEENPKPIDKLLLLEKLKNKSAKQTVCQNEDSRKIASDQLVALDMSRKCKSQRKCEHKLDTTEEHAYAKRIKVENESDLMNIKIEI